MLFNLGPLEVGFLLVLGVILFGPDKLPKLIGEVARFIRKVRDYSDNATREIRSELGPEFDDFDPRDLNPRTFVRKQLARHGDEIGLTEFRGLRSDLNEEAQTATRLAQELRRDGEETLAGVRLKQTEPTHNDSEPT